VANAGMRGRPIAPLVRHDQQTIEQTLSRPFPRHSGHKRSDMDRAVDRSRPPSRLLLALEVRAIWELQAFLAAYPLLQRAPRGDGHPVLVLPGLAASDVSTRPLRTYPKMQGYTPHGWKQGPNHGPRSGVQATIDARLVELAQQPQGQFDRMEPRRRPCA
jgi:hypothetical protein